MLNNIVIGKYYPVNSKIHRMNPISKIICTLLFVITLFLYNNILFTVLLLFFVGLIALMTNIPLKIYLKSILTLKVLVLSILIINLIFKVSLIVTIINVSRLILVVLYSSILTLTTPPTELTFGLEKVLSPLAYVKIPVNKLSLMITHAIRFIPTIIDQTNVVLKSQASRGIDYKNNTIKGKILGYKTLLLPIFIYSFKKADELAVSMELRLYDINKKRTNYKMHDWNFFDTYMFMVHFIILVMLILREYII